MGSAAVGGEELIRRLTECPKGRYYNELQILKRGAMEILSIQVGQPKSYGVADAEDPLEDNRAKRWPASSACGTWSSGCYNARHLAGTSGCGTMAGWSRGWCSNCRTVPTRSGP